MRRMLACAEESKVARQLAGVLLRAADFVYMTEFRDPAPPDRGIHSGRTPVPNGWTVRRLCGQLFLRKGW